MDESKESLVQATESTSIPLISDITGAHEGIDSRVIAEGGCVCSPYRTAAHWSFDFGIIETNSSVSSCIWQLSASHTGVIVGTAGCKALISHHIPNKASGAITGH